MKYVTLRLSLIFFLFLATACFSQDQIPDSLTVAQAVRLAIARHPAIQQATQKVIASQARIGQSQSAYYPDISSVALYSRLGPEEKLTIPGGETFPFYPLNAYDFHLEIGQIVYDFGRRKTSVDLEQSKMQSAQDNVDLTKMNLAFQTIQTFYAILYLQQNIRVLDEKIAALNEHLRVTQKKAQTGSATDFDVLTTQVRVAAATSEKVDVANTLQKQEINFRHLVYLPPDKAVHLRGQFTTIPVVLNSDSLIAVALNQRPEAKSIRDAETNADIQYRLDAMHDKPSLNFDATFGFKNGYFPDLTELRANWVAGMRLQVPIFNGFRTHHLAQESFAKLNAVQAQSQDVERQIISDVQQAVADVQASLQKLQTTTLQLQQAEDALEMANVRYKAGVITNLDLLDAQTSLSQAKLVHVKAQYDFVRSRYALEKAVGNRFWLSALP